MSRPAPASPGASAALLHERARQLAMSRGEARGTGQHVLIPVEVAGQRFALEALRVHQVLDARGLHPLLGAPAGVLGAITCRTRPVGVLDLRPLLGLEDGRLSDLQRVVVVEDGTDLFGLAVERVLRRIEVAASDLRPAPPGPFCWLAPDRLAVLDPSRLGVARPEEAAR